MPRRINTVSSSCEVHSTTQEGQAAYLTIGGRIRSLVCDCPELATGPRFLNSVFAPYLARWTGLFAVGMSHGERLWETSECVIGIVVEVEHTARWITHASHNPP